jgi:hypothetical protein
MLGFQSGKKMQILLIESGGSLDFQLAKKVRILFIGLWRKFRFQSGKKMQIFSALLRWYAGVN